MYASIMSQHFPQAEWTGESDIHVSHARQGYLPVPFHEAKLLLKYFDKAKIGGTIWRQLYAMFPETEWLLDSDEFHKLIMADLARFLAGLGPLETPHKLRNPVTGNRFHRMSLFKENVGGCRFWLEPSAGERVLFGFRFRFRWESIKSADEEENVREDARERIRIAAEEYVKVENTIMDVAEPPQEQMHMIEQAIMEMN